MNAHWTILHWMLAVLVIALVLGALRNATLWWASALFTLEILLFGTAVLLALTGTGVIRSASVGFAVFGMMYIHVELSMEMGNAQNTILVPHLIETTWLHSCNLSDADSYFYNGQYANMQFYEHIVHSFGALLFACIGALFGVVMASRAGRQSAGIQ